MPIKSKSHSMLAALGMQLVAKYSNVAVQLGVTMVLARLLTPVEYGTVAIVTVFTSFFSILGSVGISTAIIQFKNISNDDFDALFFFCLLLGLGLAGVFCLASVPISLVYRDSLLVPLCCFASLATLFSTMNMVPNGVLLRERRFAVVSVRLVVASVISGVLAIGLAAAGWGCWALVWQSVASSAVILVWNWLAAQLRLSNPHFVAPLKRIWSYSLYQTGFTTINYFARNSDNLLVGAIMGSSQLGYYDKAYKLMGYPINYLTGIFSEVLQPYLSEYQDKKKRLYESWLGICRMLSLVGMLVTAVFVCFPYQIVLFMFGDQWAAAAPVTAALGLSVGVQMVNSTSGAIFQSAGRTDKLFKSGVICTIISIVAILMGVGSGSLTVLGFLISIAYFCHFGVTTWLLVVQVLGVRAREFLGAFAPSAGAAVVAIALTISLGVALSQLPVVLNSVIRALVCFGSYAFVIGVTGEWRAVSVFRDLKRMGIEQ